MRTNGSLIIICSFLILWVSFGNAEIFADQGNRNTVNGSGELTGEISGSGSYCAGMTVSLTLTISGGLAPFTITLTRSGSIIDIDTIISGITSTLETINVKMPGTYTLKNLVDANLSNGIISGNPVILTELPVPFVQIHGLGSVYSKQNDVMYLISGTPAGGSFKGPGLFLGDSIWYFLPLYAPVGINQIVYSYRESDSSCYGYDTANVSIWESNAFIEFPGERLTYCQNEKPFVIRGMNLANDTGSFSISGGIGLIDNHDNTAIIDPSSLTSNQYTVTYTYFDGTALELKETFEIAGFGVIAENTVLQNGNVLVADINDANYQWIDCNNDNLPITGQTDNIFISPLSGNFSVIIEKDGCVDTSYCYGIIISDLSPKQIRREIEVYPNPFKETVFINLGKLVSNTEILITEMNGRVLLKESHNNVQLITLSLQAPPGIYLLVVNSEWERVVFPIVIAQDGADQISNTHL
jgi:hypothetical protein